MVLLTARHDAAALDDVATAQHDAARHDPAAYAAQHDAAAARQLFTKPYHIGCSK